LGYAQRELVIVREAEATMARTIAALWAHVAGACAVGDVIASLTTTVSGRQQGYTQ